MLCFRYLDFIFLKSIFLACCTMARPTNHGVKLEQQKAMLMDVQQKLEKYHELGGAASNILNTFEDRLKKLELTILPVYNETEHLQRRQTSTYH